MILLLQTATSWVFCTTDCFMGQQVPHFEVGPTVLLNPSSTGLKKAWISRTIEGKPTVFLIPPCDFRLECSQITQFTNKWLFDRAASKLRKQMMTQKINSSRKSQVLYYGDFVATISSEDVSSNGTNAGAQWLCSPSHQPWHSSL